MQRRQFEEEMRFRNSHKPWLIIMETNVYQIPERLAEFGEDLFVAYNTIRERYEIHTVENLGDTFAMPVYLDTLDARVFDMLRARDVRSRGKQVFREMEENNEKLERRAWQRRQRDIYEMAKDMRSQFAKLAWEM